MPAANDELVKVAVTRNPWRKNEHATGPSDLYLNKKLKERWEDVAKNYLLFSITGSQAKSRVETLMNNLNTKLKRAQSGTRSIDGGSGSDDMPPLNERERNLKLLLESKEEFQQFFDDMREDKTLQQEKKSATSDVVLAAAASMFKTKSGLVVRQPLAVVSLSRPSDNSCWTRFLLCWIPQRKNRGRMPQDILPLWKRYCAGKNNNSNATTAKKSSSAQRHASWKHASTRNLNATEKNRGHFWLSLQGSVYESCTCPTFHFF